MNTVYILAPSILIAVVVAAVWLDRWSVPVILVALGAGIIFGSVLLTYGLAEAAGASGMLAVFVAGFAMGNRPFVHKQGVANFSSTLSSIANIGMFVLMGLLVFPHQWSDLWMKGIALFLVLTFVARPASPSGRTFSTWYSSR